MEDRVSEIQEQLDKQLGIHVEGTEVELPEDRAATECLTQVADFLFQNNYIQLEDLPIMSGYKRYLINTEPKHQNGDDMLRPKTISKSVYVETNNNKEEIKRRISTLLQTAYSN